MKKFLSVLLCIIIILSLTIPCFAWQPYGNVTENTSQISILIDAMLNDVDFNMFDYWIALRDSDLSYTIYFNIDPEDLTEVLTYRYYATSQGYNQVWHLEKEEISNFSFPDFDEYTIVGNYQEECILRSQKYQTYSYQFIVKLSILFIMFSVLFFTFRVRKRSVL